MKLVRPVVIAEAMLTSSSVPETEYPAWAAGTSYAVGQRVIKAHRVYESAVAANVGNDPTAGGTQWLDVGPTIRWAMFDPAAGQRTVSLSTITVVLAPGAAVDAIGLIDVDAASVRLRISVGGVQVYDQTRSNGSASQTFTGLPTGAAQTITLTVTPAIGKAAAIGKMVIGNAFDLGSTEDRPTIAITDYSRRETDDFGVTTVVQRAWARRVSIRTRVNSSEVDEIQRRMVEVRAAPALWIGEPGFESLTVYGYYKDFSEDVQLGGASFCSLTIEGLASSDSPETVVDPGPDRPSDLMVVRPIVVSDDILLASDILEDDYPEWSPEIIYAQGERVIRAAVHRIYESAVGGNAGNIPTASAQWLDVGPTNRWAMFDQALGSATVATDKISLTLRPDSPISALAVIDTDAASVRVQAPGYDRTQETIVDGVKVTSVTFLDLVVAAGSEVTVTIAAAAAGPVEVGTLLTGDIEPLGVTETSPTVGINDFSRKETDDFGNTAPVERAWAKRMDIRSLVSTDALENVLRRVAALRAKPALWIGQEGFDSLTVYGFFRDFTVEMGEHVSTCRFTIEGLTNAGKQRPPFLSYADGTPIEDLKPAEPGATEGAPDGTNVGGVPAETVITDRLVAAETLIEQTLNSYGQRQRVMAMLHLNGRPIRAVAQIITQARVDELGNAFARAGFEVDANGIIGGLFLTSDGSLVDFRVAADKFQIIRPGTPGTDPNDILLSVEGTKTRLHDVEVDSIKARTVTPPQMDEGATGERALQQDATAVGVTSTATWTNIQSVQIIPRYGNPILIDFTAWMVAPPGDGQTFLYLRVVRDDGTPIYGGASGNITKAWDEGGALHIRCVSGSIKDRPTTFTLQGKKATNSELVNFQERIAIADEESRVYYQTFELAGNAAGEGPTAGTGGGGSGYNPNPYERSSIP